MYGKWRTQNYGYVTAFGGVLISERDKIGVSYSNTINCPKGVSQVVEYTRADADITLWGDVGITSQIYMTAN